MVRLRVKLTRIIIPGSTALSYNLVGIYVGNLVYMQTVSVFLGGGIQRQGLLLL